ncbi:MAG TPA: DUF1501 domain-containing protein [Baekduia sp.]|uniref:DUF1501 domain-containing protein n=1 Tax=Baekduia sp. TaxID=2600305 RepID=UPI002D77CC0F|nr:DUF1501 domain-containing protein [Baekduia sp.]HET6510354.1 DUF1501 domain-containing protein [Baekduia sp.]
MPRFRAHAACQDFHRASEAARRDVLTRRQMVKYGIGAGVTVYAATRLPTAHLLDAAAAEAAAAPDAPVLVSVFLPGGLDLLDTLMPLDQEGALRDLRGGVSPATPLALKGTSLGLHPALGKGIDGGLQGLYDRGQIGFLPGIDYANPNLSHFASRAFWETGMVSQQSVSGWLGRWLDRHGSADNPLQGLSSGYGLSPTLRSAGAPVASVSDPGDARLSMWSVWGDWGTAAVDAYNALAQPAPKAAGPAATMRAARLAHKVSEQLAPYAATKDKPDPLAGPVAYPDNNDTADRLKVLAGLLSQPLGIRVATVDADGEFDTHEGQAQTLERDLGAVGEALAAFQADLEARGLADRVLTFVWSEFGRRPQANKSQGTDHGAGGVAWVQGPRALGGILTEYPSLTALDPEKNLKVTVDFRKVYGSLIGQWLGTDPAEVIPNAPSFGSVQVVR